MKKLSRISILLSCVSLGSFVTFLVLFNKGSKKSKGVSFIKMAADSIDRAYRHLVKVDQYKRLMFISAIALAVFLVLTVIFLILVSVQKKKAQSIPPMPYVQNAQPMQYAQAGQPMQYAQTGQPMQYVQTPSPVQPVSAAGAQRQISTQYQNPTGNAWADQYHQMVQNQKGN